ncbi:MAG: hypothetical protein B6I30_08220 [Desulfobacteraceae bacterium 4572_187]|nr:MAG: hypothetical protein B6I30_08220 [Desulfobacteraceae bacterium 4572_187]
MRCKFIKKSHFVYLSGKPAGGGQADDSALSEAKSRLKRESSSLSRARSKQRRFIPFSIAGLRP